MGPNLQQRTNNTVMMSYRRRVLYEDWLDPPIQLFSEESFSKQVATGHGIQVRAVELSNSEGELWLLRIP